MHLKLALPFKKYLLLFPLLLSCIFLYAQTEPTRTINIVNGERMRQLQLSDSTTLITLAGNAIVKQDNSTISADSIAVNQATGIAECFGNVHINDADSVHTYAQYLKYIGQERIAYLKKKVKLTDGKGTLLTDDMVYNIASGVGSYANGGKVVNGNTILTSTDATYFTDTKDVFFKKFVHLTDPQNDIKADSLRYNTLRKEAYFIAPTRIVNKNGTVINTKNGIYNLETGQAEFFDRTSMADSTFSVTGGRIAYDEKSGILQVQDKGKIVDSVNNIIMLGDELYLNKKENTFLGTRKPVMIIYRDNDSTYITADTLFSGVRKYDSTSKNTVVKRDTVNNTIAINTSQKQDTIRYFLAFHHVKIYNDSLQAASDSLYYGTEDSVFRMYQNPVCWNGNNQVSGDTMYLFTKNQKPEQLYVFYNSMVIARENEQMYNQITGRTLNAYFINGYIDYVRVKGSPAESIYFPIDDDSAYVGMNRSSGDVIDIYFINKELNKIKFINAVDGTLYPLKQIPPDSKYLKGFHCQDSRRPKNKLDIFE